MKEDYLIKRRLLSTASPRVKIDEGASSRDRPGLVSMMNVVKIEAARLLQTGFSRVGSGAPRFEFKTRRLSEVPKSRNRRKILARKVRGSH